MAVNRLAIFAEKEGPREPLTIFVEKEGALFVFDRSRTIVAQFNPNRLTFNRSVTWQAKHLKRDIPEMQFTGAEPGTLNVDLFFDTYDHPSYTKKSVRDQVKQVLVLTTVEHNGEKHRPPLCVLSWGSAGIFFQGVLATLEQQYTLFMDDGTPVRATLHCTFKEWRKNEDDIKRQLLESSDVAKTRVIKRGETLSSIAATEYRDPRLWRPIAMENDIDDPINLIPGSVLLIPTLGDGEPH